MKSEDLREMYYEVQKNVVGRKKEIRDIIAALMGGRNVILEGAPGTSKSTILKEITKQAAIPFQMVEGSAELTPTKLIGSFNPAEVMSRGYQADCFKFGPLTTAMMEGGFLYIEEFNRIPEDVMNVLIRSMDERRISIPRLGEIIAADSFRVIGAMNPFDDIGTERISRAVSDRFSRLFVDYQDEKEEMEVVRLRTDEEVHDLAELAVRVARETRAHPDVKMGCSVRGAIDMLKIAGELFLLEGIKRSDKTLLFEGSVISQLLLDAALMAFSSKVWVKETCERTPEQIIVELWNKVLALYLIENIDGVSFPNGEDSNGEFAFRVTAGFRKEGPGKSSAGQTGESSPSSVSPQQMGKTEGDREAGRDVTEIEKFRPDPINKGWYRISQKYRYYTYSNDDTLKEYKDIALKMVLNIPKMEKVSRTSYGEFAPMEFNFGLDELDIDRTVEKIIGKKDIEYRDFIVRERVREKRAFALMLDTSGSMKGENILMAAIAATSLVNNLKKDEYAIVAFSETARVIKPMNSRKSLKELVDEMFDAFSGNMTNITSGLRCGLDELYRTTVKKKIGIILTDGAHNQDTDPLVTAKRFPKLSVIGMLPPNRAAEDRCRRMAKLGHGLCIFVNKIADIPIALTRCLKDSML